VDLPGFGGSDKPDSAYSLDAMAGRLSDLIDRSTEGPVVVIGHSMGGEIAVALTRAKPDRIVAAVLIAPAGFGVGLGGIADTMYPGKAAAIGWYLSSRAFLLPEHDPDWLAEPPSHGDYSLTADPAYRRATALVLQQFDFRAFRSRQSLVSQPVLLLWGGLDPVIPVIYADSIAQRLRCARKIIFPKALHRPQVEIPDPTLAAILGFLQAPSCTPGG
jgi:pimeloyl-ACP methyl ester carboxylesterase